jgi:uncharacterized protein
MQHKIIFTGPVGAGKTTAINAISDIPVVSTEARPSDETVSIKSSTTVAMDYGVLVLAEGTKVHLYGTPGQTRFSFMWEILSEGALGLIVLIDASAANPLAELETYLRAFTRLIEASGECVVVGVTCTDLPGALDLKQVQAGLTGLKLNVPVFEVDAREREDVRRLLLALLAMLDPSTRRSGA